MPSTCAPWRCSVAAEASSSGPLPATSTRRPVSGQPCLASAWAPPAPVTPGKVQPGNGNSNSRAPVASTSAS